MKVLVEGHRYELENFERKRELVQFLQFIHREKKIDDHGEEHFVTTTDGTTNEEVLKVLIDRMYSMQMKAPCRENSIVITKLEECLMWLEKRTRDRQARGVEGTPKR
jgi:hypothetical protein